MGRMHEIWCWHYDSGRRTKVATRATKAAARHQVEDLNKLHTRRMGGPLFAKRLYYLRSLQNGRVRK